jgi:hypothetical protein
MTHPIKMRNTGNVYTVDEAATQSDIRNKEPKFFSTSFGKRETFEMYRGFLIVRHTVQYSGSFGQSGPKERKTLVYLFDKEHGTLLVSGGGVPLTGAPQARRFIDRLILEGEYYHGM